MVGSQGIAKEGGSHELSFNLLGFLPFLCHKNRFWEFLGKPKRTAKPTPPQAKGKAAEAQALRKAVTELSPEERDAVLLRYLARLDYGDVAAICDMDQETACKKAGKGLLRLRQITTGASADTRSTAPNPPSKPTGTRG